MARPALDRDAFFDLISMQASAGGVVKLRCIDMARDLGIHPISVMRMIDDLEASGRVSRFRQRGGRNGHLLLKVGLPVSS